MEGFIATHPSGNEEWTVKRNGPQLTKTVIRSLNPEVPTPLARITRTTTLIYRQAGVCLTAFRVEKGKAKKKGFKITNIDSTTKLPKRSRIKGLIKRPARTIRVLGHRVPLDEP